MGGGPNGRPKWRLVDLPRPVLGSFPSRHGVYIIKLFQFELVFAFFLSFLYVVSALPVGLLAAAAWRGAFGTRGFGGFRCKNPL